MRIQKRAGAFVRNKSLPAWMAASAAFTCLLGDGAFACIDRGARIDPKLSMQLPTIVQGTVETVLTIGGVDELFVRVTSASGPDAPGVGATIRVVWPSPGGCPIARAPAKIGDGFREAVDPFLDTGACVISWVRRFVQ